MAEERNPMTENPAASDLGTADGFPVLAPWLMEILVCPADRAALRQDGDALVCLRCGRRYPVRDGIPVMIADDGASEHTF